LMPVVETSRRDLGGVRRVRDGEQRDRFAEIEAWARRAGEAGPAAGIKADIRRLCKFRSVDGVIRAPI